MKKKKTSISADLAAFIAAMCGLVIDDTHAIFSLDDLCFLLGLKKSKTPSGWKIFYRGDYFDMDRVDGSAYVDLESSEIVATWNPYRVDVSKLIFSAIARVLPTGWNLWSTDVDSKLDSVEEEKQTVAGERKDIDPAGIFADDFDEDAKLPQEEKRPLKEIIRLGMEWKRSLRALYEKQVVENSLPGKWSDHPRDCQCIDCLVECARAAFNCRQNSGGLSQKMMKIASWGVGYDTATGRGALRWHRSPTDLVGSLHTWAMKESQGFLWYQLANAFMKKRPDGTCYWQIWKGVMEDHMPWIQWTPERMGAVFYKIADAWLSGVECEIKVKHCLERNLQTSEKLKRWRGLEVVFSPDSWEHLDVDLFLRDPQTGEIMEKISVKSGKGTLNRFFLHRYRRTKKAPTVYMGFVDERRRFQIEDLVIFRASEI